MPFRVCVSALQMPAVRIPQHTLPFDFVEQTNVRVHVAHIRTWCPEYFLIYVNPNAYRYYGYIQRKVETNTLRSRIMHSLHLLTLSMMSAREIELFVNETHARIITVRIFQKLIRNMCFTEMMSLQCSCTLHHFGTY